MHIFSKRIFAVTGIGLGVMVLGMFWSIVNTALASIQKDLSADVLQLQWMMNTFGIFLCVPLLTMGKLGDAYGRKRLFLGGLLTCLLASIMAGFTTHIGLLITCMGLFGLSGSAILPLSQALLVHQYPENEKVKAIGLWSVFVSISLACGPLVGGLILNFWGWRWVYWINIPIILLTIPIVFFFVRKETEQHKSHCDWLGVGLLAVIIGSLVLGIMQGPTWGWVSFSILGLFAVTLISLFAFIAFEKRAASPLFRPDLFSQRSFLFSALPNACMIGFIWNVFFLIPLYLQNMLHYTALNVGIFLILITLPVVLLSIPVSKLYSKWGAKPLLLIGFSLSALASIIQILSVTRATFWLTSLSCLCIGLGWVFAWGPSTSTSLSSIPHHLAGIASGMFTTMQEVGAVVSLAIGGVFFRTTLNHILAPKMGQINSALHGFSSDQINSLLSNPVAVENSLGKSSPLIPFLHKGFIGAYENAFWFLLALCVLAFVLSLFLPKRTKTL